MELTNRSLLIVLLAVAGFAASAVLSNPGDIPNLGPGPLITEQLAASAALGNVSGPYESTQEAVLMASAEGVVYFPSQYKLNAPDQVSEHIQAF